MKIFDKITVGIFAGFVFLIIALTIVAWWNNRVVNENIDKANSEINCITHLIINDSLVVSNDGKLKSVNEGKGQLIARIDTTGLIKRIRQINEVNLKLESTKKFILDANTITYLIQIISFLLIGMQIFIGNKNERKTIELEEKTTQLKDDILKRINYLEKLNKNSLKESETKISQEIQKTESKVNDHIERLDNNITIVINSNSIINFSEVVYSNANRLNEIKINEDEHIRISSFVSTRTLEFMSEIQSCKKQSYTITPLAKVHSLDLLYQVRTIFLKKDYNTKDNYFKEIYNRLVQLIQLIENLEVTDIK